MIVRNEVHNIRRHWSDKWDEVIVIDTGSEDNTIRELRKRGAKVIEYRPEIEIEGKKYLDYGKARNKYLEYATSEWIFSLDADESIKPEEIDGLKKLIKKSPEIDAFYCRTTNDLKNPKAKNFDEKKDIKKGCLPRFFRNGIGINYFGIIHERIDRSLIGKKITLLENMFINHKDFWKKEVKPAVNPDYVIAMKKQVEMTPDSHFHWYLLSTHYSSTGQGEKALEYIENAINVLSPENSPTFKGDLHFYYQMRLNVAHHFDILVTQSLDYFIKKVA